MIDNEDKNFSPESEESNVNDNSENKINLDKETPRKSAESNTPPPLKREFEVEEEWAETLHIKFDPQEATGKNQPPTPDQIPPRPDNATPPPMPLSGTPGPIGPTPGQPDPVNASQLPPMRPEPMPPTYLVWSILATICCCIPAGIGAIIFSASVSSKYYAADYEGARRASRQAEIWIIISIVAGIISNALYLPLTLLMPS